MLSNVDAYTRQHVGPIYPRSMQNLTRGSFFLKPLYILYTTDTKIQTVHQYTMHCEQLNNTCAI